VRLSVAENRAFLGRLVTTLVDVGVRQFIDLGSGLPTRDNVHQIVQQCLAARARQAGGGPGVPARVVYVDNDTVVCNHGRALVEDVAHGVVFVQEDLRAVRAVVEHDAVRGLIDFTQPVALLMIAVLHFVPDSDDPAGIVAAYRDALPVGSYLAISHASADGMDDHALEQAVAVYDHATAPFTPRSQQVIGELFGDWRVLEPGVGPIAHWRPDQDLHLHIGGAGRYRTQARTQARFVGGVAVKEASR
jgi:hypothetical protein